MQHEAPSSDRNVHARCSIVMPMADSRQTKQTSMSLPQAMTRQWLGDDSTVTAPTLCIIWKADLWEVLAFAGGSGDGT